MANKLDKPEIREKYLKIKEVNRRQNSNGDQESNSVVEGSASSEKKDVKLCATQDSVQGCSVVDGSNQHNRALSSNIANIQEHNTAVVEYDIRLHETKHEETVSDVCSDRTASLRDSAVQDCSLVGGSNQYNRASSSNIVNVQQHNSKLDPAETECDIGLHEVKQEETVSDG
jgi:hypothetical protein